jgi:histidine ammonia-lyase
MARSELLLTGNELTPAALAGAAGSNSVVRLAPQALERMAAGQRLVERFLEQDRPVYGLNTGLGARVGHRLPAETLRPSRA